MDVVRFAIQWNSGTMEPRHVGYTLTLHKFSQIRITVLCPIVANKTPILDSGFSIRDNRHDAFGGVDKHRASSNPYPASTGNHKVLLEVSIMGCHF